MDVIDIFRYFGALALVLALVGGAGLAMRRFGLPGLPGGGRRRLSIVESLIVGKNHRVCIVKCDSVEHIIVMGPNGATVIEKTALVTPRAPIAVPDFAQVLNDIPASEEIAA